MQPFLKQIFLSYWLPQTLLSLFTFHTFYNRIFQKSKETDDWLVNTKLYKNSGRFFWLIVFNMVDPELRVPGSWATLSNIPTLGILSLSNLVLFPTQGGRDCVKHPGNTQPSSPGAKHWLVHNPYSLCPSECNSVYHRAPFITWHQLWVYS